MSKYTKKELVSMIQDYSKVLGRTPKMKDIAYNNEFPPINQFLKAFRTWNNLLKECNLRLNAVGDYSKRELLDYLKLLSKKIGRSPLIEDLKKDKDVPSPSSYFRQFDSWNNALRLTGLEINMKKDYTNEELLNFLGDLSEELGRTPMMKDFKVRKDLPDSTIFQDRFGSWNNALRKAGLGIKYVFRKWTKEELLQKLREKAKEIGRCPSQRDIDKDSSMPAKGNYRKYFGTFNNAVREARLNVNRYVSKEELIKILQRLARKLNRTPTREDLKADKGCPSLTPFVEKFGGYTAACLRAGLIPNDGRNNKIWKGWQKHCERMARVIYKNIEIQKKGIVNGFPDIHVPDKNLFIDAKTCGYRDFKEQIKRYCSNGHRLEFWLIFKGIETKRKKVKYIYAEELADKMRELGKDDLSAKCHQFIRNVFDEGQGVLK